MKEKESGSPLTQLDEMLHLYLVEKAPFQLPDDVKEVIVKFGPWIALVLMILAAPVILAAIGLGTFLAPFAVLGGGSMMSFIPAIVSLVSLALEAIALPGLFKRTMQGWNFMFYSQLVSIIGGILSYNIVGTLIGAVIGLYILYQVKNKYK